MKIYILRHEERPIDNPSFLTELTDKGKITASNSLKNTLNNIEFTHIYSSPFLRALQTITPYVQQKHYVNIEYGLAEGLHDPIFKETNDFTIRTPPCYISNYKSVVDIEKYRYYEDTNAIKERVKTFYDELVSKHKNEHDIILLSSHQCICNILVELIQVDNRYGKEKENPRDMHEIFDMGKLAFIDDNNNIVWIN